MPAQGKQPEEPDPDPLPEARRCRGREQEHAGGARHHADDGRPEDRHVRVLAAEAAREDREQGVDDGEDERREEPDVERGDIEAGDREHAGKADERADQREPGHALAQERPGKQEHEQAGSSC